MTLWIFPYFGSARDRGSCMAAMPEGEVFTLKEVAEFLKVNVATVRAMARSGEIEAFRVRHNWRVTREALESFVQKRRRMHDSPED